MTRENGDGGVTTESGVMLLELILVLAIFTVLMLMTMPVLSHLSLQSDTQLEKMQLLHAINFAAAESELKDTPIVLCGTVDRKTCDSTWPHDLMVFIDPDECGHLHRPELLLLSLKLASPQTKLTWHPFRYRHFYLYFSPKDTLAEEGRFIATYHHHISWQLTLNKFGRARFTNNQRFDHSP
jgi:Tfp pilus assembly protein FimT